MKRFVKLLTTLLVPLGVVHAQEVDRPPVEKVLSLIRENAVVGFSWVDEPLNKIVLVRTKTELCAIKFTSFHRRKSHQTPSFFRSGGEYFFADYDVVRTKIFAGTRVDLTGNVSHGHLSDLGLVGLGRMAWQRGETTIKCGDLALPWVYPTAVGMDEKSATAEYAPSNWADFSSVQMDDPSLRWYRYDASTSRPLEILSLSVLPD